MGSKRDLAGNFGLNLPPQKEKPPVDEKQVARFVEKPKAAPAPERRIGPTKRREGPGARINIIIPFEVEARLREQAFKERRSMSDAMTEALLAWLASRENA